MKKNENNDTFENFLFLKKQSQNKHPIDWEKRKGNWLQSLDILYSSIKNWMSPFLKKSLLDIKEKEIELFEDYLGNYKVKQLDIYLGDDIISLTPRGTLIIGSYGRIDMRGTKGEIMIIEPEWNNWKFAKRTPRLETWDANEDSFKSAIKEVIDG